MGGAGDVIVQLTRPALAIVRHHRDLSARPALRHESWASCKAAEVQALSVPRKQGSQTRLLPLMTNLDLGLVEDQGGGGWVWGGGGWRLVLFGPNFQGSSEDMLLKDE